MSKYVYNEAGDTADVKVMRWYPECDDDPTDAIVVFTGEVPPLNTHIESLSTSWANARWVQAHRIVAS